MAYSWFLPRARRPKPVPAGDGKPRAAPPGARESGAGNLAFGRSRPRGPGAEQGERQADAIAPRLAAGRPIDGAGRQGVPEPVLAPPDAGRALPDHLRASARAALGAHAERLRLHDGAQARETAALLGARAFYDGGNLWLGPGASDYQRELLLHELAHAAQGEAGVHLRAATGPERRAWLAFFDHYLPRKFLNNYMDDTGTPITLTLLEMMDVNPIVNIAASPRFRTELQSLQAQVQAGNATGTPAPAVRYIDVTGPGQAMTNGTLGNFTIHYQGILTVTATGDWMFTGFMTFYDVWDFDPKPFGSSGRSFLGELKTRVAAAFLPGCAFEVFSVPALCFQSGSDPRAVWAGGVPRHVGDRAVRATSDIVVGDVGGGEVAGPGGAEVGGETGAQSAEDLNR